MRCYTRWGYDSWMPLLGIWLLVVSQQRILGPVCWWFQETWRKRNWVANSCDICGIPATWIFWVKGKRWNTQPKRDSWSPAQGMKENKGASFTSGACTYCTVVVLSFWKTIRSVPMMCQWCWTTVTTVKYFKVVGILGYFDHKKHSWQLTRLARMFLW